MTATGPEGTAWSCVRGGAAGGEGQGLHQRVVGIERAAQGCGHGPECWSSTLSDIGFDLGWCCVEPGVDSMILVGPFQLGIFYDSVFSKMRSRVSNISPEQ